MIKETGYTDDSLRNARILIPHHGPVARIEFKANVEKINYSVTVYWTNGHRHCFTGFSWGYGGTGPSGLNEMFDLMGLTELRQSDIPIDQFGKTDATYFVNEKPSGMYVKGKA